MEYLVTSEEMKQYDANTISVFGIPSAVLMERAALAVAQIIEERFEKDKTILIVSGTGNNGGDGLAIGRILTLKGFKVTFVLVGKEENCRGETKKQLQILKQYGLTVETNLPKQEYDMVVDAIFGIGLSRAIGEEHEKVINEINRLGSYKIAVDMPSGISADAGKVMGNAIKADLTVTFAFKKIGLILYPGSEYAGEIKCVDIGITKESFLGNAPMAYSFEKYTSALLPKRKSNGNKGTFGKLLLIAGSENMSGASQLAALSAYRMGVGMVRIYTPKENREILQKSIPEALLTTYDTKNWNQSGLEEAMEWASVVAIGPGLSTSESARNIVAYIIKQWKKPLIIDADALNCLAENKELLQDIREKKAEHIIFTPHIGEFARLCKKEVKALKEHLLEEVKSFAKEYHITLVCKDARTIISNQGNSIYINQTGNDGMATAGSGDVLTGIIAALSAQGMTAKEAAETGVFLHGMAGDRAKTESNAYYIMANDMIEKLKYL